jgi:hypothetical protein
VTVSAPDRVSDPGDLIDRVLASGDPDGAAGALILAIRSGRGGGPLRAALESRLEDERTRGIVSTALTREAAAAGSHLLAQVADFIQYGSAIQASIDVTRILSDAITSGTTDERLLPPVCALMRALTSLDGVRHAPAERPPLSSDSRQEREKPTVSPSHAIHERSNPAPSPADVMLKGPISGFPASYSIPESVERIGDFGEVLTAPLFRPEGLGRGPGPFRVPAGLLPPPDTKKPDLIRSWLRGDPVFFDSIGITCGLLETGDPGDLMEMESEFHADPHAALRLYKARDQVPDGTSDAAWCARLGRDIGRFNVTHDRAVKALSETLSSYLRTHEPERSAVLIRGGAIMRVKEELAEAVCGLLEVEQEFISDGPQDVSGPPQILLGSFSPTADLSGGSCLERAIFIHLLSQVPFGTAMRQSLTDFRLAQAIRENPKASFEFLSRRYDIDAALPLSELSGREAIVRLGFTEPAF